MKFLSKLILFFLFIAIFSLVIAYARGYRFDFQNRSMSSTGIMAITSYPKTAKIYLNGLLKGVTDANLTLSPGNYQVEIKKEGYTSWTKSINLKGELVINIDAVLYPINPTLSPLTNLGVIKAIPLEDTDKIIVFTETGVYLFEAGRRPLSFFPPLKTIVKKELFPETINFSTGLVSVSPDLKQAIFEFSSSNNASVKPEYTYLLSLEEENQSAFNISLSEQSKQALIDAWEKQKEDNFLKILETYPSDFAKIASDSFKAIAFSPNETKILYQSLANINLPTMTKQPLIATNQAQETRMLKKNEVYVYDKKEDKNYLISDFALPAGRQGFRISDLNSIQWYFDSRHLVIEEAKKISIVDYDNSNRQAVYSGPFEAKFFTTTSDGKIIILANLNPEANKLPDLYLVGIR